MEPGFDFGGRWCGAAENAGQEFEGGLDGAFAPAMLLTVEGCDLGWEFCWAFNGGVIDELPAFHLGAIGEIDIFGEGVVLPSTGVDDTGAAPDSGGAVEIEPAPGGVACGVFDDEMTVEEDGLAAGEW